MSDFPVDKHLFEDDSIQGLNFEVKEGNKFIFKINGKIIKVIGDSKWEMIKRWFGLMKDD